MDDGSPNGYFSQNPNQSQTQSGGRRRQKHPGDYLALLILWVLSVGIQQAFQSTWGVGVACGV